MTHRNGRYALNFVTWFVAITLMLMAQHEWGKYWPKGLQRFTRIFGPLVTIAVLAHALNTPDIVTQVETTQILVQFWVFLCVIGLSTITIALRVAEYKITAWWRRSHPKQLKEGAASKQSSSGDDRGVPGIGAVVLNPNAGGRRPPGVGSYPFQAMESTNSYEDADDIPLATIDGNFNSHSTI